VADGQYLVFLARPSGYELHERDGEAPAVGDELSVNDLRLRVTKVGPSPLPADARLCVYVETA
jgi:hypothetical protein